MNNPNWNKLTSHRKPISIDKKTGYSSYSSSSSTMLNNEEKKKEIVKYPYSGSGNKQVHNTRRNNSNINALKKHREISDVKKEIYKDVNNLAYNCINHSGDSGSQASAEFIRMKAKATKTTLKVLYKTPKGIVVSCNGIKHTYKKLKAAPKEVVNKVKHIKAMPTKMVNAVKSVPVKTMRAVKTIPKNIKRGTIKSVRFSASKGIKGGKIIKKGFGKGISFAGNSLSNSNDIGIQSVGYSVKFAQYSVKITKAVKKITGKILKKGVMKILIPVVAVFIGFYAFWESAGNVVSAIAELLEPSEQYHLAELNVLSQQTSLKRAELVEDLNNTLIQNAFKPIDPVNVFYYKTSSGQYVSIENANDYFLSEEGFKELIRPILHISLLIDFDGEFDGVENITSTLIFQQRDFRQTLIRGANRHILGSGKYVKIHKSLNAIYGMGNWEENSVQFEEYVRMVYDLIWDNLANVITEELPTEWCNNGKDNSGNPYASSTCYNHSETMYHPDDLNNELNSCDSYYYVCKGTHKVAVCNKQEHIHNISCYSCHKEEHTHTGSCYGWLESGGFGINCKKEPHTHTSSCLICNLEEHTHTNSCYEEVHHTGELDYDCGNATKHIKCNGYQICLGHRAMAVSLDYASLEKLEQEYIVSRIHDMELVGFSSEAQRIKDYYEFYLECKDVDFD